MSDGRPSELVSTIDSLHSSIWEDIFDVFVGSLSSSSNWNPTNINSISDSKLTRLLLFSLPFSLPSKSDLMREFTIDRQFSSSFLPAEEDDCTSSVI